MQRRPAAAKYGRNKGRALGYNFFENEPKAAIPRTLIVSKHFPTSPSSPLDDPPEGRGPAISQVPRPPSPAVPSATRPVRTTSHSRSSLSPNELRSVSMGRLTLSTSATPEQSTFDIFSSEDDRDTSAQRPSKKRKIEESLKVSKPVKQNAQPVAATMPNPKRQVVTKKQQIVIDRPAPPTSKPEGQPRRAKPRASTESSPVITSDVSESTQVVATRPVRRTAKKTTRNQIQKPTVAVEPTQVDECRVPLDDSQISPRPTTKKRTLVKTKTTDTHTPKKHRSLPLTDDETSIASAGSLGFTDLRLTPDRSPGLHRTPEPAYPTSPSPRRGRLRRIDMLDHPKQAASQSSTRLPSLTRDVSVAGPTHSDDAVEQLPKPKIPNLSRSNSSHTRGAYAKVRSTYGKERSHLADMVDDFDLLDSSQEASQQLASQLAASSGPSQLQMELELEDSWSDDAGHGVKLKSIHELRQAGSNDRFDRDLEALLADIDPTSKSNSKALRLSACTKLFTSLCYDGFPAFVVDHGLERLVAWSRLVVDNTSKLLLTMIFWRLTHANNLTPTRVRQMVQAAASSTSLITNLGTMTRLIKERKENLSKQMISDLQSFERTVLREALLPAYEGDHVVPAAVALGVLNDCLRATLELGSANISIGKESYQKILLILEQVAKTADFGTSQDRFITKLALSLLLLFSGPLEEDPGLSGEEYLRLGDTLGSIAKAAGHEDLVQSVLHFAISLCNDKPDICEQFNDSNLATSIMELIEARFPSLLDAAESQSEVDPSKLDSIILSLACLLSLTEHDDNVRIKFAHRRSVAADSDILTKLTAIYTQAAPRLENAMTAEKSQILVAFGYLSCLMCNLCLVDNLWLQAARSLGKYAMSDVKASAKELLIHLQTLEMSQGLINGVDEDATAPLDGFTQRLAIIVAAVRDL